jgi:HK97 family phage major capsid protein
MDQLQEEVKAVGHAVRKFKEQHEARVDELGAAIEDTNRRIEDIETQSQSMGGFGGRTVKARRDLETFMREGKGLPQVQEGKAILTSTPTTNAMLPKELGSEISRFAKDSSAMLRVVRVSNVSTQYYSRIVRTTPPGSAWIGESGTRALTSDANFRERQPTHGEIYSRPELSQHVLNDSAYDLAGFLIEDIGLEIARQMDTAIISGNGSNRPTGVINTTPVTTADFASPLRSADAIQYLDAPSPDSLADHLIDAYFALNSAYRRNAVWCMNSQSLATIRKLKASTSGEFLWQPNLGSEVDAGNGGLLLGHPVVINESMPNIGESPLNFPIIVGDWNQAYEAIQIGNIRIIRDEVTNPGFVRFFVFARWGGILVNNDAVKALRR